MYQRYFKRIIDLTFSLLILILISPILLILIITLSLKDEGEVFYMQERVGTSGNTFNVIKFATMVKDSPNIGYGTITAKNDPRITKTGRFMRKTKLNEVPQLFNIVLGEMSLIGPRPMIKSTYMRYSDEYKKETYGLKSGLSGLGSLLYRNEEQDLQKFKNKELAENHYRTKIIPTKQKIELYYKNNISFMTDLLIIALTLYAVVFSKRTEATTNMLFRFHPELRKIYFNRS